MTGDERLAKVAEVLHDHGLCIEVPTATTDAHEHRVATCHRYAQALAPLLEEFRAEDEARALRKAADDIEREREMKRPNSDPLTLIALDVAAEIVRALAALAAAETDAGER